MKKQLAEEHNLSWDKACLVAQDYNRGQKYWNKWQISPESTLGEEILAGRKFGGFGKNPPN